MALATRCPHCHTTFRVAHDQLKLRAGLVRCGACKEIFNGVEHLLPASVPAPAATSQHSAPHSTPIAPIATHEGTAAASSEQAAGTTAANFAPEKQETENNRDSYNRSDFAAAPAPPVSSPQDDPLQRMTLMDFSAWKEDTETVATEASDTPNTEQAVPGNPLEYSASGQEALAEAPDEVDRAIEDLQRKPWRRRKSKQNSNNDIEGDEDAAEPDFVRRARRQQQIGRIVRVLLSIGSFLLLITLVAQATYTFRDQVAAWVPETTPILLEVCAHLGCDIGLPAQIDAVSIESSELQALAPNQNTFVLNTLLRNRSATAQAWPSIELTLNDANEKTIARRVFSPRDYLAAAPVEAKKGLGANSEQLVKVYFELQELKASGYRVYLFYP